MYHLKVNRLILQLKLISNYIVFMRLLKWDVSCKIVINSGLYFNLMVVKGLKMINNILLFNLLEVKLKKEKK